MSEEIKNEEATTNTTEAGISTVKDYILYPRQYESYRWFRPIVTALLAAVFFIVISNVMTLITSMIVPGGREAYEQLKTGYDGFDAYSLAGAIMSLGSIACMLLALFLATLVLRDRPLSSYSSARGGWRFSVFFKCFAICLVVSALPVAIITIIGAGDKTPTKFTILGFILCTILGPLQCIAEEYIFRGLLFQAVGSWTKNVVIAIIISMVLFMSQHPYNIYGVLEVGAMGALMCIAVVITKGLEASSAIHITNNMTLFYLTGFGISKIQKNAELESLIESTIIYLVYVIILYVISKKYGWFEPVKKDDVTPYNAKYLAKKEVKRMNNV